LSNVEIHLVRHGRSALVHDGRWFRWADVPAYEDAYDAHGIRDDDRPGTALESLVKRESKILASDLPRAIASAARLGRAAEVELSPLLREIRLEPPRWIPMRLPIQVWDVFSHVQWSYRLFSSADHEYVRRANAAVDWLIGHASRAPNVVAVTHGGFRRILDARLVARGWSRAFDKKTYDNWSVWSYRS
jgi:broad specificity phosphatase PhoE